MRLGRTSVALAATLALLVSAPVVDAVAGKGRTAGKHATEHAAKRTVKRCKRVRRHHHRVRVCHRVVVERPAHKAATPHRVATPAPIAPAAAAPAPAVPVPAATPTPAPTATPAAPAAAAVQVAAKEFALDPSRPSVAAGKVILQLVNFGEDAHDLAVLGPKGSLVVKFPETEAGGVVTRTLSLAAGRYTLFCTVAQHQAEGMQTTLDVTR
jgi:plastocyanin